MVMMGLRLVMGSWKTVAIRRPRIWHQSLAYCTRARFRTQVP